MNPQDLRDAAKLIAHHYPNDPLVNKLNRQADWLAPAIEEGRKRSKDHWYALEEPERSAYIKWYRENTLKRERK